MTKSRDNVTMTQKLCLKGNTISTAFSPPFLKKSRRLSLRSSVLCGFMCARLRLALVRAELGRSALNNLHLCCRFPETPSRVTIALLYNVFQTFFHLFLSLKSWAFSEDSYPLFFICSPSARTFGGVREFHP